MILFIFELFITELLINAGNCISLELFIKLVSNYCFKIQILIHVKLINRAEGEEKMERVVIGLPAEAIDDPEFAEIVERLFLPVLELYEAEPEEVVAPAA